MGSVTITPFVTADELAAFTGTTPDYNALFLLDAACQAIRTVLDRTINETTETFVLDGNGKQRIVLPQFPIVEVSLVEEDGDVIPEDEYFVHPAGMLVRRETYWSLGVGNIEVTCTHGWTIATGSGSGEQSQVPADLRAVALRLASRLISAEASSDTGVITSETIGKYSYTKEFAATASAAEGMLTSLELAAIDKYRKG
jgi:hypothetical protein